MEQLYWKEKRYQMVMTMEVAETCMGLKNFNLENPNLRPRIYKKI